MKVTGIDATVIQHLELEELRDKCKQVGCPAQLRAICRIEATDNNCISCNQLLMKLLLERGIIKFD